MEETPVRKTEHGIPECMLIIDDDEINRGILDNIFSPFYTIEEAENGKIAYHESIVQKLPSAPQRKERM